MLILSSCSAESVELWRKLYIDDARVEDVDEVTELDNVLVDALHIEVLVALVFWQGLEREEMLEDHAA